MIESIARGVRQAVLSVYLGLPGVVIPILGAAAIASIIGWLAYGDRRLQGTARHSARHAGGVNDSGGEAHGRTNVGHGGHSAQGGAVHGVLATRKRAEYLSELTLIGVLVGSLAPNVAGLAEAARLRLRAHGLALALIVDAVRGDLPNADYLSIVHDTSDPAVVRHSGVVLDGGERKELGAQSSGTVARLIVHVDGEHLHRLERVRFAGGRPIPGDDEDAGDLAWLDLDACAARWPAGPAFARTGHPQPRRR
jgi:hypothetical protein